MFMRSRARAGLGIALFFSMLAAVFGVTAIGATAAPYETVSVTTMDVAKHQPLIKQGEQPVITVTVSSAQTPVGTVVFTVKSASTGAVIDTSAATSVAPDSGGTASSASYIFPVVPARDTYEVTAVFTPADSARFTSSNSTPIFITVLPGGPAL